VFSRDCILIAYASANGKSAQTSLWAHPDRAALKKSYSCYKHNRAHLQAWNGWRREALVRGPFVTFDAESDCHCNSFDLFFPIGACLMDYMHETHDNGRGKPHAESHWRLDADDMGSGMA
jgi:hypothetical protein